jgi:branched-chain amino acid transport system permease protein
LGLKGMTAALLGRLGSLRFALAGGLVLGALEGLVLASSSLGARWADVLVIALLAILAATRPRGLLA